ncbi:MAG: NAD(P)-binding protein, partial [Oscillospiraceae bacterium]|nr:NAD(P)-binding protein [Oscillospiraceae bacterium]
MKKAAIIGAGLGGLTFGAYLARDGYEVTVFDKNSKVGGVCALAEKNGYKWEQGPLILGDMLPGDSVFEILKGFDITLPTTRADRGIEMPDYTMWYPDEYAG